MTDDRPAAIRRAVRSLVARRGFHGASMGAVATEAGVATGTAYVHYRSKEELLFAAYLEAKRGLGDAAMAAIDPSAPAEARFRQLWHAVRTHLERSPDLAAFLVQFDASPYAAEGHRRALDVADDPFRIEAARPDLAAAMVPLPPLVLYDLAIGPLIRMIARRAPLDDATAERLATAAWRSITE